MAYEPGDHSNHSYAVFAMRILVRVSPSVLPLL